MDPIITVVVGLIGTVGVALITYLSTRRTTSGNLEASKAEDLWASMRGELERYQTEATALRTEATALRTEAAAARTEAALDRAEVTKLREEAAEFRSSVSLAHVQREDLNERLFECLEREKRLETKPKPRRAPRVRPVTE